MTSISFLDHLFIPGFFQLVRIESRFAAGPKAGVSVFSLAFICSCCMYSCQITGGYTITHHFEGMLLLVDDPIGFECELFRILTSSSWITGACHYGEL